MNIPNLLLAFFLIAWGFSILVKIIFKIEIPVFSLFLAGFLIALGVNMLLEQKDRFIFKKEIHHFSIRPEEDEQSTKTEN